VVAKHSFKKNDSLIYFSNRFCPIQTDFLFLTKLIQTNPIFIRKRIIGVRAAAREIFRKLFRKRLKDVNNHNRMQA